MLQHFFFNVSINFCINILETFQQFLVNIFLEASSNIFQKCWTTLF
jgi:hypothetical protein